MCVCLSYFDSSIGGVSHSLQQLVVLWIKCDGEGTVNDSPCKQTPSTKPEPLLMDLILFLEIMLKLFFLF